MIRIIEKDGSTKDYEQSDIYALQTLRHTGSHVMANAIKRLYPNAKLAIGPYIDNGFYYDIDFGNEKISDEDFPKIEDEMKKIIKENATMERYTMDRAAAVQFFKDRNEDYKVELVNDLPENEKVYFAKQDDFIDLCGGSHLLHTSDFKHFKLMSIAGAYWRGNEKNKMLTRIYATAFFKKEDLDAYIAMMEEAKKRDHRKIGRDLGIFMISDFGPGFPFFLPNGMIIRNTLMDFWRKIHKANGYDEIMTPIILNKKLWETSGHWEHYGENMYSTRIDDEDFCVKPMNCPGSILVYMNEPRSYRDLPKRFAEPGIVHRHEKSGELHGLMRVRCFTQDDAHIYITQEQIEEEVTRIIKIIDEIYKIFKFDYFVELSTRPDDRMGTDEEWDRAEAGLANALKNNGMTYILNEGDGAFYGPKIDFHLKDCLGRTWQCGTIQLDIQLPQRFNLEYIGADGEKHQPIMIHRVCFGSIERFMGILIEHFAGAFPTWLSPTQVEVIPVSDKTLDYAKKVKDEIEKAGIRVHLDDRAEKMGYKIREAQTHKIPYMLVVGPKEAEDNVVSVRSRFKGDEGCCKVSDFITMISKEIDDKTIRKVEVEPNTK
ncbi:MAG: threonine--tRNA ligase [Lachnospiraceae bacterium]|nr:threonine--tRNA ligase [Lachnospiraceae bacterium]